MAAAKWPEAAQGGYEFTAEQNRLIADLARKMSAVGIFFLSVGGLAVASAVYALRHSQGGYFAALLLAGVYLLVTGWWKVRSGRCFRLVVDTSGSDIEHTMRALAALDRLFTLSFWLVIAYVVLVVSALLGYPAGLS